MVDIRIVEWIPLPDILVEASSLKKELVISNRKLELEVIVNIDANDEVEFVEKSLSIIKKIEELTESIDIDKYPEKVKDAITSDLSAL